MGTVVGSVASATLGTAARTFVTQVSLPLVMPSDNSTALVKGRLGSSELGCEAGFRHRACRSSRHYVLNDAFGRSETIGPRRGRGTGRRSDPNPVTVGRGFDSAQGRMRLAEASAEGPSQKRTVACLLQ